MVLSGVERMKINDLAHDIDRRPLLYIKNVQTNDINTLENI